MGIDQFNSDKNPHRWMIFFTICMVYFFVYFHRVSTSVIVSDLLNTFHTSASALGFMSSMYFYLYAFEQPLVGYLSDRIGPRRVIAYWSVVAAAGCFIFAMAPGIGWASIGRALIGIGVGGVYVPAIKAFSIWFRKKEFATMIGLLMSVGNFGAMIATTPLAWASETWGWRLTFYLIGGITLLFAFVVLMFTRDHESLNQPIKENLDTVHLDRSGTRTQIFQVLSSGQFWIIAMIFFGIYGTLVTLQGLWATPFLMAVLDIERVLASKLNMLIPIGVIIGAPFFGWLPDRYSLDKRKTLIAILGIYNLTWIGVVFFFNYLGAVGLSLVLLIMGIVAGGFISILWGIVREITPSNILGLTSGVLNPAPFFGVAIFQVLTGVILDHSERVGDVYSMAGFKNAFLLCLLSSIVCMGLSLLIRKPGSS
ncbi:MAG: MFS transporter [Deltaproteobacteria bacterium]|nr:MFS transporter [Deltaproteobacteria bacterium]